MRCKMGCQQKLSKVVCRIKFEHVVLKLTGLGSRVRYGIVVGAPQIMIIVTNFQVSVWRSAHGEVEPVLQTELR